MFIFYYCNSRDVVIMGLHRNNPGIMISVVIIAFISLISVIGFWAETTCAEPEICRALPGTGDLYTGLIWKEESRGCDIDSKQGSSCVYYHGYSAKDPDDRVAVVSVCLDWNNEEIASLYGFMSSPDAYRQSQEKIWSEHGPVEPIPDLPGGLFWTSDEKNGFFVHSQAFLWKRPGVYGNVDVNAEYKLDTYTGIGLEKFSRDEAIRLAKLTWSRLDEGTPGPDAMKPTPTSTPVVTRDYGELIWTLRYYLSSQFGKYPDEVLYKALVINESGVLGRDQGITYALKDNMMRDITSFRDSFSKEIPGWQGRLVDEAGENVIGKEIEDTMGVMDITESYITAVDAGLGYESGIALPEFGPIYGLLGLYRELEKKMRFYRDNIVIPDIADEIYHTYKSKRAAQQSPKEAFDDAIYGSNAYYQLRSYPVFAQWKPEDLDLVLAERFEQRYHTEELLDLRAYMLEHGDLFIRGIIWQYRDKLDRLERTCQAITDGRIQADIPYEVYKIEKWWYLPKELRGG